MMRKWFESLVARDQMALIILAAIVGSWVFVQVIFVELDGRRERIRVGNGALVVKLSRIDLKVEQLAALRADGGGVQVNLTRTLSQVSETLGLPVKRLQPNSRGEVQIRFEDIAFDGLLQFLEQIEGSSGLAVIDGSISSAGNNGGVNATLRVSGA
jgi:general secretion pathway protein M